MKFSVGDAVVHPIHGAGVVTGIKEPRSLGGSKQYYSIELLGQPATLVMVPVKTAEKTGIRRPISRTKLKQIWHVLRANPEELPSKHELRYQLLKDKLHGGDIFQVAEALRDLAWRREEKRYLTTEGKRLFDEGLMLLAGEIASVQGGDYASAEAQLSRTLDENLAAV